MNQTAVIPKMMSAIQTNASMRMVPAVILVLVTLPHKMAKPNPMTPDTTSMTSA